MNTWSRRQFLSTLTLAGLGVGANDDNRGGAAEAIGFKFEPHRDLIPAPPSPSDWPAFREELRRWREETRRRQGYNDALYRRPDFAWVPATLSCCFVMLNDGTFYDHRRGRFKVEPFLDHGRKEFGGFDALVLWHAYPRIGLDARNQFDFYRDQPGGLKGLRDVSRRCHARRVKVFLDYNPWDIGTRREPHSDLSALTELVAQIEADGIFLDTMDRGAAELRANLDAARPGVVLEGEGALPLERIADHHASWAQWFPDSVTPGILRNKWFERRHLQHQIQRWNRDHTGELHTAWMNGTGMMVWENVFGTWVGWNARDRSLLRSMLPIQRRYLRLFCGEGWTPLVSTEMSAVFASLWAGGPLRLWTLINRSEKAVEGTLLKVASTVGARYFDLIRGRELPGVAEAGLVALRGTIPARGIGAFLAGPASDLGKDFTGFLAQQRQLAAQASLDARFQARTTLLQPVVPTRKHSQPPAGMVEIAAAMFELKVEFRVRECGFYEAQSREFNGPSGYPLHQPIRFQRQVTLARYAMDLTPVTNAQFAAFLQASGYQPRQPANFLKHWPRRRPPEGQGDHPVVYVDLGDARAYARWAGKRLPTEEEWQYAAQGPEGRRYPWGNEMKPGRCNGGETGGTTSVTAFPDGRSPFGCYDLCGNTWEWTESERSDGRARFCFLRGGSYYRAKGSDWYMDGGPQPASFAAKFLLMWGGLDRCATVGFRCVVDLA